MSYETQTQRNEELANFTKSRGSVNEIFLPRGSQNIGGQNNIQIMLTTPQDTSVQETVADHKMIKCQNVYCKDEEAYKFNNSTTSEGKLAIPQDELHTRQSSTDSGLELISDYDLATILEEACSNL